MPFLQDIIHQLEVGAGWRFLRIGLAVLAIVLLVAGLQLAWLQEHGHARKRWTPRRWLAIIAQGKGYTTLFIRPFSMYLVKKRNPEPQAARRAERERRRGRHQGDAPRPGQPAGVPAGAGRRS